MIDHAAVERAIGGDQSITLTAQERREVVRRLHESGLNDFDIHRRTGFHPRTVLRHRQRLHLAHNWFPQFTYQPPRKATT